MIKRGYYKSTAPDSSSMQRLISEDPSDIIESAKREVASGAKQQVYIVKIVGVVERDTPPVKVTMFDEMGDRDA